MPRTVWTKLHSDPNGTWTRHEGEPPFSIPGTPGLLYDVLTDSGESFAITPQAAAGSALALTDSGPDMIELTSNSAGTLYYGLYPAGTGVGDITIADMVAGTDGGLIDSGTAGVFVAAGVLPDITIPDPALPAGSDYVGAFVVDIDDAGTYSNLVLNTFTTSASLDVAFIGEATLANNGTGTYSFPATAIGAAAADREIYVVVQFYGNLSISQVSFDGGAVVDDDAIQTSGNTSSVGIARAMVASGSTTDIEVSFSTTPAAGVKISVFRVTGKSGETAGGTWTISNQGTPQTGTISVAQGGAVIAGASERGSVGDAPVLTGASQVGTAFDTNSEDYATAGLATGLSASASYVVGVSKTGNGAVSGAFIGLE